MKKIMIDMDDVICGKGFLRLVNSFLNTDYKEEEIKQYYIQDLIPQERKQEYKKYFCDKNIYEYAELLPGVCEVMRKLSKKYDLYIGTAYIFRDYPESSSNHLKNKFEYLCKELPFVKPENYIFTTNKEIINCEIKIDDKLSNLEGNAEIKLLFSAYHNREITDEELKEKGVIRVDSWYDIEKILLKNEEQAS